MVKTEPMSGGTEIARFGPRLPDVGQGSLSRFFSQHNVLGYDNGDGELACCKVDYDANRKKLYVTDLSFNETSSNVVHVPNILFFETEKQAELASEHFWSEVYHNFKRCPGVEAKQKYQNDRGEETPYTYEDLMSHSFACVIRKLFRCNKNLEMEKPTIIMVGHPSSRRWKRAGKEYAEILGRKLESYLPGNHGPITILVLAESCAAMAGAIEMNQRDWLEMVTQILDLGSSSFDLTTVTPGGIPEEGEESFQFGGNQLDKAIVQYGTYLFEKKYPPAKGYAMADAPEKMIKLRFKKELCYGDNGSNLNDPNKKVDPYSYYVMKKGDDGEYRQVVDADTEDELTFPFTVSRNIMGAVLTNKNQLDSLKCRAENLDDPFHTDDIFESWENGCEYVLTQFHQKTESLCQMYGSIPRRLILTGGVSNMPEVQQLAKQIFGAEEVILAQNPSQTVSRGLGLIMGSEVIKKAILSELEQELLQENSDLPGADTLLEEIIREACKSDLDYYEKVIERWAYEPAPRCLNDCICDIGNKDNGIFDPNDPFVDRACKNWFEESRIDEKIEKMLHEKFQQLFPEFVRHFHGAVSMPAMQDMSPKDLRNEFKINLYMFFDETNCPDDPYNDLDTMLPREVRQNILEVFRSHRKGLAAGTDTIRYRGNCSVRIDNSGSTCGERFEGTEVVVESISSVYSRQLSVEEDAAPLRNKILEMLKPQIRDFVESLTYYLTMG